MSKAKVDLTLLKKLVAELEAMLVASETIDTKTNKHEHVIELSKAAGVAAGVMSEAAALIGDIQYIATGTPAASPQDILGKLLPGFKGSGNTN